MLFWWTGRSIGWFMDSFLTLISVWSCGRCYIKSWGQRYEWNMAPPYREFRASQSSMDTEIEAAHSCPRVCSRTRRTFSTQGACCYSHYPFEQQEGWRWVSLSFNSLHAHIGNLPTPNTGLPVRFSNRMEMKPEMTASKGGWSRAAGLSTDWLVTSSWGSLRTDIWISFFGR